MTSLIKIGQYSLCYVLWTSNEVTCFR